MGTAGRQKFQYMALVDAPELRAIDAIRIITRVSRAEITRQIIKGETTLSELRNRHRAGLDRLDRLAFVAGLGKDQGERFAFLVCYGKKVQPMLEELEALEAAELRAITSVAREKFEAQAA